MATKKKTTSSTKKKSTSQTTERKPTVKKTCTACHKNLALTHFYRSVSPLHSLDKKAPICKDCVINNSLNTETGEIDIIKFKNILRQLDKPYYKEILVSSRNQFSAEHSYVPEEELNYHGADIIRLYMKNIGSLRQLSHKSYADSEADGFTQKHTKVPQEEIEAFYRNKDKEKEKENPNDEIIVLNEQVFEVTPEMVNMFGEGYSRLEYKKMYQKYEAMTKTYIIQTNLHQEALLTYIRFKVKEEMATAKGDVQEAQKWYQAAQDAAEKAKLTPRQLSKEDLQGGLTNFSDIFTAVEGAKERIKIFPEFKYQPNDAADFIIWCYVNYERNLNNLPEVEYSDIYKFYDKKKQEYINTYGDTYGIFTEDTTEYNRSTIENFITIPKEFQDGDE